MEMGIRRYRQEVLRVPPYHPDLNPFELVRAALYYVHLQIKDVMTLSDTFYETFPAEEWKGVCDKVISIEDNFVSKEPLFDKVFEEIINLGDDDLEVTDLDDDEDDGDEDPCGYEDI
ncbi:hypothetical protein JTB14_009475 [Gonioctena quinquepunctata]|nr:hypothetical protein JTB14_009475 [Gonioctena quinquepunctata]